MLKYFMIAAALCCLLVSRQRAAEPPPATLPSPLKPGRYTISLQTENYLRTAQVHIPRGYQPDTKPPLVLLLHGGGGSGTSALEKDGWADKADQAGFVVVAPEGLGARPTAAASFKTNPAMWNSGQHRLREAFSGVDDVAFIRALLDTLREQLPHDQERVFCTGHSNGGGMTFRLASELSDRFAAVACVAGRLTIEKPKPSKLLPTLYIIGTVDPLMPLAGGEVKSPWGGSWTNRPVEEQLVQWAEVLGCEKAARTISDSDDIRKLEYPSKNKGPTLTVIYLDGHGHHWPGGKQSLPESMIGPIKSKLNATETIWNFFEQAAKKT
jgi:polyhydroxybutyrate depolymerase